MRRLVMFSADCKGSPRPDQYGPFLEEPYQEDSRSYVAERQAHAEERHAAAESSTATPKRMTRRRGSPLHFHAGVGVSAGFYERPGEVTPLVFVSSASSGPAGRCGASSSAVFWSVIPASV
jgi:hypothetical protein